MVGQKILVVDDDEPIVNIVKFNLQREGFDVVEAFDGEEAIAKADEENPDLIILDIMLPKADGFTVCKKVREKSQVPIIMLTARVDEIDKVLGLELGADDYIEKPFSKRELVARVKANLRRATTPSDTPEEIPADIGNTDILTVGELELNYNKYEITTPDRKVQLTSNEFKLLKFLMLQPDKVFTREQLLEKVWGFEYYGDVRTVDVTVRRIREKVEVDSSNPVYIATKRGLGYYLAVPTND